MDGGQDTRPQGPRRTALLERADRYRVRAVTPVRDVRAQLSGEAVPYEVRGMHVRVNPRLLSYWIPFVAGVGVMIGGMKTAGAPFVGIPQLVLGVALIAIASWDFVSDSGRLDVAPSQPAPGRPSTDGGGLAVASRARKPRATYDEKFRRKAVHRVRSTGEPIAAIARDLDVNPSTLAGWVRKDRIERARLGLGEDDAD
jgi:hypothetical protein